MLLVEVKMMRGITGDSPHSASSRRYDAILAAIPVIFLAALGLNTFAGVSLEGALLGASLLALAGLVDALYLRPPTHGRGTRP